MGNNITEENYKEVVLKRSIITCWVLLALCLVIKLFGGNFFNIVCSNKRVLSVLTFINESWLYYLVVFVNYCFGNYLYISALCGKLKFSIKESVVISIFTIICFAFKFVSLTISAITDIVLFTIICAFILLKMNNYKIKDIVKTIIIGEILINVFQLVSLFVKNLGIFKVMQNDIITQQIFVIDYYIMMILYCLYQKIILRRKTQWGSSV